jgi:hypothetical protein
VDLSIVVEGDFMIHIRSAIVEEFEVTLRIFGTGA